jgi:hypothetical protein
LFLGRTPLIERHGKRFVVRERFEVERLLKRAYQIEPAVDNPDAKHVSTSFAERQNLTLRMSARRFTRLKNASSKKLENHALSVALHYMHYNFCRVHKTLRVTPAMAAGVTDHVWSVADVVAIIEAAEPVPAKRGPYKKAGLSQGLRK